MRGFIPPANDEERLFCRRVEDAIGFVQSRGVLRVLPFCSDREQSLAQAVFAKLNVCGYSFYGGYAQAERKMLVIAEDKISPDDFLLTALMIKPASQSAAPGHRDYLGAMLALRIGRELLGDIVLTNDGAILFVQERAAQIIKDELFEVGRTAVQVSEASDVQVASLCQQEERQPQTGTLPSLRLDAMLGVMLRISRGAAAELIRTKAVMINHIEISSCHAEVCEGDVFTVRGKGKFKLCEIGGQSKKNRIFVSWIQY